MAITDPRDITGLRLWVSAEAITGKSDGDQISTWDDLSGNGNHLTGVAGSGGAKPLYRATASSSSGPAVQFQSGNANQAGGYFTIPSAVFTGLTSGSAWAIVKSAQGQTTLWQLGPAAAGSQHFPYDDVIYEDAFVTSRATYVGTFSGGLNTWRRYLTTMGSGTQAAYRDNSNLSSASRTFGLPTTPKLGGGPAFNYAGHVTAFIIVDHVLTSGERSDLETWGAAHPSGGLAAAGPTNISGGLASETDSALSGAVVAGSVLSGGLTSETDTALAGTVKVSVTISGGFATETDSALAGTTVEATIVSLGLATETDSALSGSLTIGTVIAGGLAVETDSALTPTVLEAQFISGGLATEADSALAGVFVDADTILGDLASETDTALGGTVVLGYSITDTGNRVGGLQFSGYMTLDWTPPVAEPPAGLAPEHDYETARAHSVPTLSEGLPPVFTTTTATVKRHRDRILVGGKDITYWRGVHTPTPDYSQVDPLLYGAGSLRLPQVHALFEVPGEGALSFLAKSKSVIVQRVDPDSGAVVANDDYRGIIMDYDIDGDDLTLTLGGEVTGRMAVRWRPTPAFKSLVDVGRMAFTSFRSCVPAPFTPRLGPETGIKLNTFGGQWEIDHLSEVLAKSVQVDGDQYTIGRRANGTWGMWLKDRETIDATIYFDDGPMKPSMKQSLSESPNRVFVTAVAKDGRRINFRVYPGLKQGDAPDYPTTGAFGEGATNDDMDNPEDAPITAMVHRLIVTGYLSVEDNSSYLYDADVTAAIKRLQEDAGLSETGNMNPGTWDALYDLDATGYTLTGTATLPAAQLSATRIWNRTSSGALSTRNQYYDPTVMWVDAAYSMGQVRSRQKAREFAKAKVHGGGDWIGSVDMELALIEGEHTPGDPIDTVMPPRALRPGMNVWAPLFDGGTLFHVSGVDVSDRGRSVKVALDTRARPTMEAWEVIQRNAESRKHPTRLWINEHRGVMQDKDGGEWDDVAGRIDDRVRLRAGRWTWFPVVAGQEGTVRSLRTRTTPAERYAMAIFGRRVGAKDGTSPWLDRLVPAPLSEGGSERWDSPAIRRKLDERILLYTAGQFEQSLGYFPGRQTNDEGEPTGHPINGRWEDDAGFSYHTFAEPVLYVAIWVAEATSLAPGRLMWDQFNNTGD